MALGLYIPFSLIWDPMVVKPLNPYMENPNALLDLTMGDLEDQRQ